MAPTISELREIVRRQTPDVVATKSRIGRATIYRFLASSYDTKFSTVARIAAAVGVDAIAIDDKPKRRKGRKRRPRRPTTAAG